MEIAIHSLRSHFFIFINLPESQVRGPEIDAGPGRSPVIPAAIDDAMDPVEPSIPDDRPREQHEADKPVKE